MCLSNTILSLNQAVILRKASSLSGAPYDIVRHLDLQSPSLIKGTSGESVHQSQSCFELQVLMVNYFHSVILRQQDKYKLQEWVSFIRTALEYSLPLALYYVESFSSEAIIQEMFLYADIGQCRFVLPVLLRAACQTVFLAEKDSIEQYLAVMKSSMERSEVLI